MFLVWYVYGVVDYCLCCCVYSSFVFLTREGVLVSSSLTEHLCSRPVPANFFQAWEGRKQTLHAQTPYCLHISMCAYHPCAGARLIVPVPFQVYWMLPEGNSTITRTTYQIQARFLLFGPPCAFALQDTMTHGVRVALHTRMPTCTCSGGRLCTLIGVSWRGVSFSTLSTGRLVLKQYICKGAESAEHAETAGYTYEGTPTTA